MSLKLHAFWRGGRSSLTVTWRSRGCLSPRSLLPESGEPLPLHQDVSSREGHLANLLGSARAATVGKGCQVWQAVFQGPANMQLFLIVCTLMHAHAHTHTHTFFFKYEMTFRMLYKTGMSTGFLSGIPDADGEPLCLLPGMGLDHRELPWLKLCHLMGGCSEGLANMKM